MKSSNKDNQLGQGDLVKYFLSCGYKFSINIIAGDLGKGNYPFLVARTVILPINNEAAEPLNLPFDILSGMVTACHGAAATVMYMLKRENADLSLGVDFELPPTVQHTFHMLDIEAFGVVQPDKLADAMNHFKKDYELVLKHANQPETLALLEECYDALHESIDNGMKTPGKFMLSARNSDTGELEKVKETGSKSTNSDSVTQFRPRKELH